MPHLRPPALALLLALTLLSPGCRSSEEAACEEGATRACMHTGTCDGEQHCSDGRWSACLAPTEICNGLDDDCDGEIDEDFSTLGQRCQVGQGACEAEGTLSCGPDGSAVVCSAEPGEPQSETCNGLDDDCDGEIDEDFPTLGQTCRVGQGVCEAEGTLSCSPDGSAVVCSAEPGEPQSEICNGLDDDCNGAVDDVEALGDACVAGTGVCAQAGSLTCEASVEVLTCDATPGIPTSEVCNGLDDNCNGTIDDVEGLGDACSVGVGACERSGNLTCGGAGAALSCDAIAGAPVTEICNGLDDDCDGTIDNLSRSFSGPVQLPADRVCAHLTLGDIDGDGWTDVVCAPAPGASGNPDTRLFTYLNHGDGTFNGVSYLPPVANTPLHPPNRVALGDLDGDGDLDIVAVGLSMRAQVYLNAGDGTFAAPSVAFPFISNGPPGTSGLALTDVDEDGDLDLATVVGSLDHAEWSLALSLNDGSGRFSPPSPGQDDLRAAHAILVGDVEADGDVDLVVVSDFGAWLLRPQAPGHYPTSEMLLPVGMLKEGPVLTDLDADGFPDLVVPATDTRYLLPGTASGFGSTRSGAGGDMERYLAAGQFDCDPTPELLAIDEASGGSLEILANPPDLTSVPLIPGLRGTVVQLADVDNDGDLDVVFGGAAPGVGIALRQ